MRGVSGSLFASLLLVLALPGGTHAEALLRGQPRIIDGDTIEIGNTKIRLEGIDAPETDQLCLDTKGAEWACGIAARDQLIRRAGDVEWVCVQHGSDRYRRTLATCTVDGEDINKWMVSAGWALSFTRYSHAYDNDETSARIALKGLWSGAFVAPWDWRSRNRNTVILGAFSVPVDAQKMLLSAVSAADAPSKECVVKGNISRGGECIYHMPGGHFYAAVRMDLDKRKRWFCSVEDAEAAGCRRSKL